MLCTFSSFESNRSVSSVVLMPLGKQWQFCSMYSADHNYQLWLCRTPTWTHCKSSNKGFSSTVLSIGISKNCPHNRRVCGCLLTPFRDCYHCLLSSRFSAPLHPSSSFSCLSLSEWRSPERFLPLISAQSHCGYFLAHLHSTSVSCLQPRVSIFPFVSSFCPCPFPEGSVACRNLIPVTLGGFYFPGYFWPEFWPTVSYKVSRFPPNIIIKCFLCEILSFSMYLEEGSRKNSVIVYIGSFLLTSNCLWILRQFGKSKELIGAGETEY